MRNTTAATAKTGDACCHFKSPGNDSLVRLLPRRRVAYCNCLISFPVKIAGFIFIFKTLGKGYGTREIGRKTEKESKGRSYEQRHTVRRETKHR